MGRCPPTYRSVRVPVPICIGEGASRMGRPCEGLSDLCPPSVSELLGVFDEEDTRYLKCPFLRLSRDGVLSFPSSLPSLEKSWGRNVMTFL